MIGKIIAYSWVRILIVGGVSLSAAWAAGLAFLEIFPEYYQRASLVCAITYLVVNFLYLKYWALRRDKEVRGGHMKEVWLYLFLHGCNQAIIALGLHVFVEYLGYDPKVVQVLMQLSIIGIINLLMLPRIFNGK